MAIIAYVVASYCARENFGAVKFWQITTDKACDKKNFGRSSVISLYY